MSFFRIAKGRRHGGFELKFRLQSSEKQAAGRSSSRITSRPYHLLPSNEARISSWLWQTQRLFSTDMQDREQSPRMPPLDTKFGIVAAMSKNGVIGVDGGIPWRVPQDRKLFKTLTDKGIMIFGKRTFEEHPTLAHINHTRGCIIVSRSMKTIQSNHSGHHAPNTILKLARSLPEGLVLAGKLKELFLPVDDTTTSTTLTSKNKESDITCWIAGGQRLYEEALTRDCVAELHLSVVDIDIDYSTRSQHDDQERRVAMFPPRNLWTDRFEETSKTFYSQDGDAPSFNYYVYHRRND